MRIMFLYAVRECLQVSMIVRLNRYPAKEAVLLEWTTPIQHRKRGRESAQMTDDNNNNNHQLAIIAVVAH
jgi:hypothetical protein